MYFGIDYNFGDQVKLVIPYKKNEGIISYNLYFSDVFEGPYELKVKNIKNEKNIKNKSVFFSFAKSDFGLKDKVFYIQLKSVDKDGMEIPVISKISMYVSPSYPYRMAQEITVTDEVTGLHFGFTPSNLSILSDCSEDIIVSTKPNVSDVMIIKSSETVSNVNIKSPILYFRASQGNNKIRIMATA